MADENFSQQLPQEIGISDLQQFVEKRDKCMQNIFSKVSDYQIYYNLHIFNIQLYIVDYVICLLKLGLFPIFFIYEFQ